MTIFTGPEHPTGAEVTEAFLSESECLVMRDFGLLAEIKSGLKAGSLTCRYQADGLPTLSSSRLQIPGGSLLLENRLAGLQN